MFQVLADPGIINVLAASIIALKPLVARVHRLFGRRQQRRTGELLAYDVLGDAHVLVHQRELEAVVKFPTNDFLRDSDFTLQRTTAASVDHLQRLLGSHASVFELQ